MKRLHPFATATNHLIARAREEIISKYENNPVSEENLPFHNYRHAFLVNRNARKIIRAVNRFAPRTIPNNTMHLVYISGAFHDVVQDWTAIETTEGKFTKRIRVRDISAGFENEKKSAEFAEQCIREEDASTLMTLFTDDDIRFVKKSIEATAAYFDKESGTFVRPYLSKDLPFEARILSFADLSRCGIDPIGSFQDSDNFFREINLDMNVTRETWDSLPNDHQEYFKLRIIAWTEQEIGYVEGRKLKLDEELEGSPEYHQNAVRMLLTKFDDSKAYAQMKLEQRKEMTPLEVMIDTGFFKS